MGDIGTILHEILHALGLYHEISRTDREQHVYINWDNIQEGKGDSLVFYQLHQHAIARYSFLTRVSEVC